MGRYGRGRRSKGRGEEEEGYGEKDQGIEIGVWHRVAANGMKN